MGDIPEREGISREEKATVLPFLHLLPIFYRAMAKIRQNLQELLGELLAF